MITESPGSCACRSARMSSPLRSGKSQVQQNQVERALPDAIQPLLPGRGRLDFVAFQFEQGLQRFANFGFVVDDENGPAIARESKSFSLCAQ